MTLPYESYNAVVKTSEFLKQIIANNKMSKSEIRKQAKELLKHYPYDFDVECWVKNNEKLMAEWAKPAAAKKGYIAIGRHDPVEYSPKYGGWIFWDETWSNPSKAFSTETECQAALKEYCETELGMSFKQPEEKVNG